MAQSFKKIQSITRLDSLLCACDFIFYNELNLELCLVD